MRFYNEFLNVEFEIPKEINRVVSLAPDITDMLGFLGLFDKVVGVSSYCNRPKDAKNKPKLGGYLKVNLELLKRLNPDVVLITTGVQRKLNEELLKSGFVIYTTKLANSLFDILDNVIRVGNLFSITKNAFEKANELFEIIKNLCQNKTKFTYFAEIDLSPEITFGSSSYITHALYLMGYENIFIDKQQNYFFPDYQEVKLRNPEFIIYEPRPERIKKPNIEEIIKRYEKLGLGELKAIRERKIILTPGDYLAHYGPSFITEVLVYLKKEIDFIMSH
ncbi:MAG: helical backbone metal receptor [candidate division WOR-3 bacterium]